MQIAPHFSYSGSGCLASIQSIPSVNFASAAGVIGEYYGEPSIEPIRRVPGSSLIGSAWQSISEFVRLPNAVLFVANDERRQQAENRDKLNKIKALQENWDGYGAPTIDATAIENSEELISAFCIQPCVYPTARGSVQMEYEKENSDYLEIEIFDDRVEIYTEYADGRSEENAMPVDVDAITKVVESFYGEHLSGSCTR